MLAIELGISAPCPNVVGMDVGSATAALTAAGFTGDRWRSDPEHLPRGLGGFTNPGGSAQAPAGQRDHDLSTRAVPRRLRPPWSSRPGACQDTGRQDSGETGQADHEGDAGDAEEAQGDYRRWDALVPPYRQTGSDAYAPSCIGAAGLAGASRAGLRGRLRAQCVHPAPARGAGARPGFAAVAGAAPVGPAHARRGRPPSRSGCAISAGWCPISSC